MKRRFEAKCPCGGYISVRQNYTNCGGNTWHTKCFEMRELGWKDGYNDFPEMNEKYIKKSYWKKHKQM